MIKAEDLTKRFGPTTALNGLNAEIPSGSIYGLVGPNGSGKSTFLRLIAGIYSPDGGRVLVDGRPCFEDNQVKDRCFYIPDDLWFPPKFTIDDMARFFAPVYSSFSEERYEKLAGGFPIRRTARLSELSKGQRRLSAIIGALSCQPDVLLLDEAFDGIDVVLRIAVRQLIAEEMSTREMTVLAASHNLRELEDMCDQIGLMNAGRLLFEKDLDSLKFGCCKVQAAFRSPVDWSSSGLDILSQKKRGMLYELLIRGPADEALPVVEERSPLYAEALPLTLEEVFIAEMGVYGYDAANFKI